MRPTLLIVEADPAIRLIWRTLFAGRGWDVREADNVTRGLASLEPAPDYLILARHLPDGDGEAILGQVREAGLKTRVAVAAACDVVEVWRGAMLAVAG